MPTHSLYPYLYTACFSSSAVHQTAGNTRQIQVSFLLIFKPRLAFVCRCSSTAISEVCIRGLITESRSSHEHLIKAQSWGTGCMCAPQKWLSKPALAGGPLSIPSEPSHLEGAKHSYALLVPFCDGDEKGFEALP